MKRIFFLLLLLPFLSVGQKWKSSKSHVRFFSEAPLEDIEAINEDASSVMDLSNGNIVFSVPIKDFEFEKSLMKEHFNENYLESDKYPKCIFKGTIDKTSFLEGDNEVIVKGQIDLHGVQRDIEVTGTMHKKGNWMKGRAKFIIKLADYKIKIPRAVFRNIAEEIEVTVMFEYVPI